MWLNKRANLLTQKNEYTRYQAKINKLFSKLKWSICQDDYSLNFQYK